MVAWSGAGLLLSEQVKASRRKFELETEGEKDSERKEREKRLTNKIVQCQCGKLEMWKEKAVNRNYETTDEFSK